MEASRSAEVRKVSADEFEGLRMLEKKKLDDESAVMKAEKVQVQHKAKETRKKDADDAKPKKVSLLCFPVLLLMLTLFSWLRHLIRNMVSGCHPHERSLLSAAKACFSTGRWHFQRWWPPPSWPLQ